MGVGETRERLRWFRVAAAGVQSRSCSIICAVLIISAPDVLDRNVNEEWDIWNIFGDVLKMSFTDGVFGEQLS